MPRFIDHKTALRQRATYEDGTRVRPSRPPEPPAQPTDGVAELSRLTQEQSRLAARLMEALLQSKAEDRAMLESVLRAAAGPQEWGFEVQRDKNGKISSLRAKRIL